MSLGFRQQEGKTEFSDETYLGKWVRVHFHGDTLIGKLYSFDDGYFYLLPCFLTEIDREEVDKVIKEKLRYFLETKTPQRVNRNFEQALSPIREEYVQEMLRRFGCSQHADYQI